MTDLRAAIDRAVRSLGPGQSVSRADVLYDTSISTHVGSLLTLVRQVHYADKEGIVA